jgi:hypothetical protein
MLEESLENRIKNTSPDGTVLPRGLNYVIPTWEIRIVTKNFRVCKQYLNEEIAKMEVNRIHREIWSKDRYNAYYALGELPKQSVLSTTKKILKLWITLLNGKQKYFTVNYSNVNELPLKTVKLELRRAFYANSNSIDLDAQLATCRARCGNVYYLPGHYRLCKYKTDRYPTLEEGLAAFNVKLSTLNTESIGAVSTAKIRVNKLSQDLPVGLSEHVTTRETNIGTSYTYMMRTAINWGRKIIFTKAYAYGRKLTREEAIAKCIEARQEFLKKNPKYRKARLGIDKQASTT